MPSCWTPECFFFFFPSQFCSGSMAQSVLHLVCYYHYKNRSEHVVPTTPVVHKTAISPTKPAKWWPPVMFIGFYTRDIHYKSPIMFVLFPPNCQNPTKSHGISMKYTVNRHKNHVVPFNFNFSNHVSTRGQGAIAAEVHLHSARAEAGGDMHHLAPTRRDLKTIDWSTISCWLSVLTIVWLTING